MPVTIEEISLLSDQDRQDLQKIYSDAPSWLLEGLPGASRSQVIAGLLTAAASPDHHWRLFAARFNSRLLAALVVAEAGDSWQIQRLCVRQLTRGRGVGRRLLTEVVARGRAQGRRIQLDYSGQGSQPQWLAQVLKVRDSADSDKQLEQIIQE